MFRKEIALTGKWNNEFLAKMHRPSERERRTKVHRQSTRKLRVGVSIQSTQAEYNQKSKKSEVIQQNLSL